MTADEMRQRWWAQDIARFSITVDDYWEMVEAQKDRCAICKSDEPKGRGRWAIDHDHSCCPGDYSCGECIRGLLCFPCNSAIGHMKDDPDIMMSAAEYIIKSQRR